MKKKEIKKYVRRTGEKRRRSKRRNRVVGLVPARGGSIGIPRKNIQVVAGYPLIAHSILALQSLDLKTYVSTEDDEIAYISKQYGASVVKRPVEFATSTATTESVISHFVGEVPCDVVVLVQCTSPMLQPKYIKDGLDLLFACDFDSVFSVVKTHDTLIWDKKLSPINYKPKQRGIRQERKNFVYIETGGFYIFRTKTFIEENCRICGKVGVVEVPFWQSFQIDNKQDMMNVNRLMER